jgi:hypothetical protein
MKPVIVKLAGKDYEIQPLPIKGAREFRQKFTAPLGELIETLQIAPKSDLNDFQAIGGLLAAVKNVIIGSMDMVLNILFEYSPELQADRVRIEDEAYDDEAITSFVEVLKLLYPFGGLKNILTGLKR